MADGAGGKEVGRVSIRVVPNLDRFREELKAELEAVEKSEKVTIPVEFDVDRAGLRTALDKLQNEKVRVGIDSDKISSDLERAVSAVNRKGRMKLGIDVDNTVDFTMFRDRMRRELNKAATSLEARIPLDVDGDRLRQDVYLKIASLRGRVGSLPLDLEITAAEKAKIAAEIAALNMILPKVDVGGGGGGFGGLGSLFGDIGLRGENLGLILAGLAVAAPAIALVSGALTALPAVIAGVLTPIAAVALGLEGIGKAAEKSREPFEKLKAVMSQRFEEKMTPIFEKLNNVFPTLQEAMPKVADGLSEMFAGFTDAVTSERGLDAIRGTIENIGAALSAARPGIETFTSSILTLVDRITAKFPNLSTKFNDLATQFSGWIDKITTVDAEGTTPLDRAMETLGGVVRELGGIAGDLLAKGFEWLSDPEFGKTMVDFVADVRELTNDVLPLTKTLFEQIAGALRDSVTQAETLMKLLGAKTPLGELVLGGDPGAPNKGEPDNRSAFDKFKAGFKEAFSLDSLRSMLNPLTLFKPIIDGVSGLAPMILPKFATLVTQIAETFTSLGAKIAPKLAAVPQFVSGAFSVLPQIVSGFVGQMVGAARGGLGRLAAAAITGAAEFVAGIATGGVNAVTEVSTWPGRLVSALGDLVTSFYNAGVDAVQGFIDGLRSRIENAATVASDLGFAALRALQGALNINSPSREFISLGDSAGEGFALGIENSQDEAVAKVKAMAKAVFEAMKEVFGSASGANLNFNFGGIGSALNDVQSSAQGLQRTLGNTPGLGGGTGKIDSATKQQIDGLKLEQDKLDLQRQQLQVQKGLTADKAAKAAIQQQQDALKLQKDQLDVQIGQLQYGAKYEQQTAGIGANYQEIAKQAGQMPVDFATATLGQFQQDIGMSGNGALNAIADWGVQAASNFVFNVSNVDEAIAVKNNQQNLQALSYT